MSQSDHRTIRRNRRLTPALEPIEGRILLSGGVGMPVHHLAPLIARAAQARRLAVNGALAGQFAPQTSDGQNFQVTITAQGNSGNRRVGRITVQTSFNTSLAFITSLANQKSTIPGLSLEITAPGGTMTASGTLTVNAVSRRSPFRVTASITGGTGQFAGATGNLTIQGTAFSLSTSQIRGNLRGTIRTTA
jgi:hypothetical protein